MKENEKKEVILDQAKYWITKNLTIGNILDNTNNFKEEFKYSFKKELDNYELERRGFVRKTRYARRNDNIKDLITAAVGAVPVIGPFIALIPLTLKMVIDEYEQYSKTKKSNQILKNSNSKYLQKYIEVVLKETAEELARIYEFQIAMLRDNNEVKKLANLAIKIIIKHAEQEGLYFDRNNLLKALLVNSEKLDKKHFKLHRKKYLETIFTEDYQNEIGKWGSYEIFYKPFLRKETGNIYPPYEFLVPDNIHNKEREIATPYGFRGELFFFNSKNNKNEYIENNLDKYHVSSKFKEGYNIFRDYFPIKKIVAKELIIQYLKDVKIYAKDKIKLIEPFNHFIKDFYKIPHLIRGVYRSSSLKQLNFNDANFNEVDFMRIKIEKSDIGNSSEERYIDNDSNNGEKTVFCKALMIGSNLKNVSIDCNLLESDFSISNFEKVKLLHSNVSHTLFHLVDFSNTDIGEQENKSYIGAINIADGIPKYIAHYDKSKVSDCQLSEEIIYNLPITNEYAYNHFNDYLTEGDGKGLNELNLYGDKGTGKTYNAINYANIFLKQNKAITWIFNTKSIKTLYSDYLSLYKEVSCNYEVKKGLTNIFEIKDELIKFITNYNFASLFIFDNINKYEEIKLYIPNNASNNKLLKTILISKDKLELESDTIYYNIKHTKESLMSIFYEGLDLPEHLDIGNTLFTHSLAKYLVKIIDNNNTLLAYKEFNEILKNEIIYPNKYDILITKMFFEEGRIDNEIKEIIKMLAQLNGEIWVDLKYFNLENYDLISKIYEIPYIYLLSEKNNFSICINEVFAKAVREYLGQDQNIYYLNRFTNNFLTFTEKKDHLDMCQNINFNYTDKVKDNNKISEKTR